MNTDNEFFESDKRQEDKFPSRDTRVWQESNEKVIYLNGVTSYEVTPDDDIILINSTSGLVTITLPYAISRRKLTFIKLIGGYNVKLVARSGELINQNTDFTIVGTQLPFQIKSYLGNWVVIAGLGNYSVIKANSVNAALTITQEGTGNTLQVNDVSGDTTPFIVDASGKVVTGWASWENEWYTSGHIASNWTVAQTVNASGFGAVNYGGAAGLLLMRSNAATIGTRTIVADGDRCGQVIFAADDGVTVSYITGASIYASVDGTPGTGDMPMRLIFATTPDGSSTPVERVRIDNQGDVKIYRKLKVEAGFPKMYFFAGM